MSAGESTMTFDEQVVRVSKMDLPLPHDCRLTARCLREDFGFSLPLESSFESLRSVNSLIDVFFERRAIDQAGGEGSEPIRQIESRPAFELHFGRMRAATWFDRSCPPQGVVWLLSAQLHDERHKGRSDAFDIFARLDRAGDLFPQEVDYARLELDRRLRDAQPFAENVRRDARELIDEAEKTGRVTGSLAGVKIHLVWEKTDEFIALWAAVTAHPIRGVLSGYEIPLTNQRFLMFGEALREAAENLYGPEVLAEESKEPPHVFKNVDNGYRFFLLVFQLPS